MAYCCVGSMSAADWNKIKQMCKEMHDYIDDKFKEVNTVAIKRLKDEIAALTYTVSTLSISQAAQDRRLDSIESTAPNTELTRDDLLAMYRG